MLHHSSVAIRVFFGVVSIRGEFVGRVFWSQEWLIKNQGRFQTYMELELGKLKKSLTALNLGA